MSKPRKIKRRVVLGVGHPWFSRLGDQYPHFSAIALTPRDVPVDPAELIKLRGVGKYGNWNKVRLVMEILK